ELCAKVLCNDSTIANNNLVKYIYKVVHRAFLKFSIDVTLPKALKYILRKARFKNV
ncbi:hypothetical protein BT67DRAFT_387977, partial [Trichocladium antarcticum]